MLASSVNHMLPDVLVIQSRRSDFVGLWIIHVVSGNAQRNALTSGESHAHGPESDLKVHDRTRCDWFSVIVSVIDLLIGRQRLILCDPVGHT